MSYTPTKKMAPGKGGADARRTLQVYRSLQSQSTTDDAALAVAEAHDARARRELRLLAAVAPLGGWGMTLADRAGVTVEHFIGDDTHAIFIALLAAEDTGAIRDRTRTAKIIRAALRYVHLWVDDDLRPGGHGMRWGPGRLARLLHGLTAADAEAALPGLAAAMIGGGA